MSLYTRSLWLSISGGGFRAALYHFGCMKRLHEVGLLNQVGFISGTSGGAFIAAMWRAFRYRNKNLHGDALWEAFELEFIAVMRRGVLGPTTLLVVAYTLYAIALLTIVLDYYWAAGFLALLGVVHHLVLATVLICDKVHKPLKYDLLLKEEKDQSENNTHQHQPRTLWEKWKAQPLYVHRFLSMMFRPSQTRWQTMDVRIFKGAPLNLGYEHMYLVAVDLDCGRQMILSPEVIATLDFRGCRRLWQQDNRLDTATYKTDGIPLALAVAASTAYPPFFRPVRITQGEKSIGTYIDGGVVDNAAINIPSALALYMSETEHLFNRAEYVCTFAECVSGLLALDASKWPQSNSGMWTRLKGFMRIPDLLANQQTERLQASIDIFEKAHQIPAALFGLKSGLQLLGLKSELDDDDLNKYLKSIRTNMDSFSINECAVIAYCGYSHVEFLLECGGFGQDYSALRALANKGVQFRPFSEFLLPELRRYDTSKEKLRKHLRHSSSRLAVIRALRRFLDR